VGIGGAGKTAIADRFLRSLPGVLATPGIDSDPTLTPPRSLFVFSFYDAPNADTFFHELAGWLDDQEDAKVSYERTVRRLEKEPGALLVLDGLEKVQDTGQRSGDFGQLLDGRLRDLVLRAAEGWLPGVQFVITSRFQLFDALAEGGSHFQQILVEELTPEASVALLRQRGVRGPDHVLVPLARDQGLHALSIDLLGGYVTRFLDGDPAHWTPDSMIAETGAEVDPQVAAIRLQERRFARLAERYGELLLESDPASLALLQRVCLFRLGVDAATLALIFTGEGKEGVAGPELANLDETGLVAKLELLVGMKLLERDEDERYNTHPAVRDGFLKNLDEEVERRGHDAVREGLEVSLGDQPGRNPSEPTILDLLEEIVHHALAADLVGEAWSIYWDRIGGYENLGSRLGAYDRGERICRAFASGLPPEDVPLPKGLSKLRQAIFINGWALYLNELGRLGAAVRCYERGAELAVQREAWEGASIGKQNLADVLLLAGHLTDALGVAGEALSLAEQVADARAALRNSYGCRAHVSVLRGETESALTDFRDALHWQHQHEREQELKPAFWGLLGVWHTLLIARLGQNKEATRLAQVNKEIIRSGWEERHHFIPRCDLVLAELARERQDINTAQRLLDASYEWAIACDAKELLCWAALVRARLEERLEDARRSLEDGLRIARDCGFGIYHIDLLLQRACLFLDQGDATAALTDIDISLFEGVHPPEDSGLPELLAATDLECGYAWGEAEGRHLRGEALLLQAAQKLGREIFEPSDRPQLTADARSLIDEGQSCLEQALECWRPLHDPQPDNVNFIHPTTGDQYNYRAEETYRLLEDLERGILTRRELRAPQPPNDEPLAADKISEVKMGFDVFLSHNSQDKPAVRDLKQRLGAHNLTCWLDEDELRPGIPWQELLEEGIKSSGSTAVLVGKDGIGPWEDEEMRAALSLAVRDKRPVIPVLLPGASSKPDLPIFLGNRTWVDLRDGFTTDGLDKLV